MYAYAYAYFAYILGRLFLNGTVNVYLGHNNMYIYSNLGVHFFILNSGMRMVGTECVRNILFILHLGAEWMEWHSVHSNMNAD